MITINRTAIVAMPGQPFLDWLHRTGTCQTGMRVEQELIATRSFRAAKRGYSVH